MHQAHLFVSLTDNQVSMPLELVRTHVEDIATRRSKFCQSMQHFLLHLLLFWVTGRKFSGKEHVLVPIPSEGW
jgi:hypothetical protein